MPRARAGGRPRNPALDEAIILATRARLVRDGYSRMTLGDIAADAGVSRPTLYRRWNSKFELVADALDYGFRKQRDQYDIDLSRLAPREALVEAVRRLDPAYFNPDAMVLMGNFAGEVIRTPELLEMLRKHAVEPRVALVEKVLSHNGPFDAPAALQAGLVFSAPDDIDWDDEVRMAIEARAAFSPDALTGMEANLRFAGPETMETKIFGRLSAWQNWIFQRPNAVGERGALTMYGRPERPEFDWRRT